MPEKILKRTEEGEAREVAHFDVGIMPLPDEPWARGKCGYKIIQYMACGVPVIASPVGVNVPLVEDSGCGYLAATAKEWRRSLQVLLESPEERKRLGVAGRQAVEQSLTSQAQLPLLLDALSAAAASGARGVG